MNSTDYKGRFAPSPTGPLHFGSLVAAAGSYLDAKALNGKWIVRMEDVDMQRCTLEYDLFIMRSLEAYGFQWDETVVRQSQRRAVYQAALDVLRQKNLVYPCACTRKEICDSAIALDGAHIYPGTCSSGLKKDKPGKSLRLRVTGKKIGFTDLIQGYLEQDLGKEVGDFILLRADGYFAYQLASVVDDALQGITRIVRGADLFYSTPRQICLQRYLEFPSTEYAHLPIAVNAAGEKLSKQTLAKPVDNSNPVPALIDALSFLGMDTFKGADISLDDLWKEAALRWSLEHIPKVKTICRDF